MSNEHAPEAALMDSLVVALDRKVSTGLETRYGRGLLIVVVNAAIVRNTLIARLVASNR